MEDNTQAAQALSKKDEAYVRIKDRIISGEYKPGSLLVERTLSDSLDMSRTPIRAALMDLCHTGLATFVPGKGIYDINARAYLSRFNFAGADQEKLCGVLSGGERNRLHLAMALKEEGKPKSMTALSNSVKMAE